MIYSPDYKLAVGFRHDSLFGHYMVLLPGFYNVLLFQLFQRKSAFISIELNLNKRD